MKLEKVNNIVLASLFSALICIATLVLNINTPVAGGYINIGDCFVFATIILLPKSYSMLAAGIGSALADLISGHAIYAPASFAVKALMVLAAWLIYSRSNKKIISKIMASLAAEIIMCAGYFAYEAVILGYKMGATANIPLNAVQGAAGIVLAVVLATAIEKSKKIKEFR